MIYFKKHPHLRIKLAPKLQKINKDISMIVCRASKTSAPQQQIQVEIEKPTGLKLRQSKATAGGLDVVKSIGNAAKAGIKAGDTVIFTSSFFGDELWPSDKLGFAQSALEACPSPVIIVYVKGSNESVNVRNLSPKPAPRRFGRKLTSRQKELASHICIDCGWIYCEETPFSQQPKGFICPQCNAPKKRFAEFDVNSSKIYGVEGAQLGTILTVIGGLIGLSILAYVAITI
jgi:rubredoxin